MNLQEIIKRIASVILVLGAGILAPYIISINYGIQLIQSNPTPGALAFTFVYVVIVILFALMAGGYKGKTISSEKQDKNLLAKLEHYRSIIRPYILAVLIPYLLYLLIKLIMLAY